MKIKKIEAYEILASNGYPTVEAVVTLDSGTQGTASVPYGASTGTHEATVIIDNEKRYDGKGAKKAIGNILDIIAPKIINQDFSSILELDKFLLELDGTETKMNLGGNSILAVSLAAAKAFAQQKNMPFYKYIQNVYKLPAIKKLPNPMMVGIEGGKHAYNSTDLQEYCLTGLTDEGPEMNIQKCLEAYHKLEKILQKQGFSTNVGNEGAFAPSGIKSNEDPLKYITQAIKDAGYEPGKDLGISIDAAANEFFNNGQYFLSIEDKNFSSKELIKYYEPWLEKYPVVTIEDMLHEDDWENWPAMTEVAKKHKVYNIGDDLTVTNSVRLQKAIDLNAINAILIKPNQIGTLSETIDTCILAHKHDYITVFSHRGGGETNDTSLVDIAVAVGAKFLKVGPTRGERVAKYNRLMQIQREEGTK